jgi:hypothetical protein
MSALDARLAQLLEQRHAKGRFRSLKAYDTNVLADFVRFCQPAPSTTNTDSSRPTITSDSQVTQPYA